MNTSDAIRVMVRHYPGGMAAIALRLDKSPNTLEKELRGDGTHKLGLVDACAISAMCLEVNSAHGRSFVNAVACEAGGFVELPVRDTPPRRDLNLSLAGLVRETSDVLSAWAEVNSDGRISANELKRIEREVGEAFDALQIVLKDIRSVAAESKPAALREVA